MIDTFQVSLKHAPAAQDKHACKTQVFVFGKHVSGSSWQLGQDLISAILMTKARLAMAGQGGVPYKARTDAMNVEQRGEHEWSGARRPADGLQVQGKT